MLGRIGRRDVLAMAILGLIGVGIPLWPSAAAGIVGVPSNDAWVYMRGAESLLRTGRIVMPAWYDDMLMSSRPCAVLSNTPLEGGAFRLIRADRSGYLQYLFFGPAEPLYLYGVLGDGCPQPPAATEAEPQGRG